MYKLQLNSDLSGCPECWQNWIRDFNDRQTGPGVMDSSLEQEYKHFLAANQELTELWHAHLDGETWDLSENLVFDTESHAMVFILRRT